MVQMPPQPERLTSFRADKYENERCGLVGVVSPRVTRTVLYSDVSLLEHARLSTVDFKLTDAYCDVTDTAPRATEGFPASPDSEGVRRVALGNEERLPDKFKAK